MSGDGRVTSGRQNLLSYLEELPRWGNRELFRWKEGVRWRSRNYVEVYNRALACASLLVEAGVRPGDTVLLQGIENADWVEALFGILRAGGTAVPLSPDASPEFRQKVAEKTATKWFVATADNEPPPSCTHILIGSWHGRPHPMLPPVVPAPDDRAEIIFTSGTTGDPKGVLLTHLNLIADFAPLEHRFHTYRPYARIIGPIRVLVSVPLSHMFGQAVAIFLLPFIGVTVVLTPPRPLEVIAAARQMKAWGLITVPRLLDLLAQRVRHELRPHGWLSGGEGKALLDRQFAARAMAAWWTHRLFGWRFMFLLSGGGPLRNDLRTLWERLGFLLSQGYGLTETAPIVTISNPFRRGPSVGRPLSNQELKIGQNGEILVRGKNVTPGYLGGLDADRFVDDWFHTGDIGEIDEQGQLLIKGRVSQVIVTAEGENVYPSDVEDVVRRIEGVRDVCVVGVPGRAGEEVHAALLLGGAAAETVVIEQANGTLQPKQRIRSHTLWREADFPRTGTGKVQATGVRDKVIQLRADRAAQGGPAAARDPLSTIVARFADVDPASITDATTLGEGLGLSSLDLVELTICVEDDLGVSLDEAVFDHSTIADLRRGIETARSSPGSAVTPRLHIAHAADGAQRPATASNVTAHGNGSPTQGLADETARWRGALRMPRWAARFPAHQIRRLIEEGLLVPLVHFYSKPTVVGRHHVESVQRPVLVVCNHRSHFDASLIKACVPRGLRGRLAPGMTTRWERVFFGEEAGTFGRFFKEWAESRLLQLLFNAWPLPRTAGFRHSLLYAGELADSGFSILLFPEGRHVPKGLMNRFRTGTGILARELRMPVLPVYVEGSEEVIREGEPWFRFHFGPARVVFGEPFEVATTTSATDITCQIQDAVRALAPSGLRIVELPPEEWMDPPGVEDGA